MSVVARAHEKVAAAQPGSCRGAGDHGTRACGRHSGLNRDGDPGEPLCPPGRAGGDRGTKSAAAEAAAAPLCPCRVGPPGGGAGLSLIDHNDSARGMLWLVRALELDPEDAAGVHRAVRVNLRDTADLQLAVPRLTLRPAGLKTVEYGQASKEWVGRVAFSPDGQTLATAHRSGLVHLWNTADGRERMPALEHNGLITALAFSPDGRQLWVGVMPDKLPARLETWDLATGRQVGSPASYPGMISAFRPDGGAIAVHLYTNAVRVFDRATGKPLGPKLVDPKHESGPSDIAFSPDGRSLAISESNDSEPGVSRAAIVWDVQSGKQRFETARHDSYHIYAIAWSPDGTTVATGGHDKVLRFWDSTTGAPKGLPRIMGSHVGLIAYSPDGRTIAVATGRGPVTITLLRTSIFSTAVRGCRSGPGGRSRRACGAWHSALTATTSPWARATARQSSALYRGGTPSGPRSPNLKIASVLIRQATVAWSLARATATFT